MNIRFLIFLIIFAVIIVALVIFELGRPNPWDSDVFFGQMGVKPIHVIQMYPQTT
ncbi:MAG: hypothetical protein R3309_09655 [Reinekea sp.]|jgi:hypothetical protein|nr:hypothetical protein [Reinekea sp.]MDX1474424.1 hypothetical protein [Reinekea sp.]